MMPSWRCQTATTVVCGCNRWKSKKRLWRLGSQRPKPSRTRLWWKLRGMMRAMTATATAMDMGTGMGTGTDTDTGTDTGMGMDMDMDMHTEDSLFGLSLIRGLHVLFAFLRSKLSKSFARILCSAAAGCCRFQGSPLLFISSNTKQSPCASLGSFCEFTPRGRGNHFVAAAQCNPKGFYECHSVPKSNHERQIPAIVGVSWITRSAE